MAKKKFSATNKQKGPSRDEKEKMKKSHDQMKETYVETQSQSIEEGHGEQNYQGEESEDTQKWTPAINGVHHESGLSQLLADLKINDPEAFNAMISRFVEPGHHVDHMPDRNELIKQHKTIEEKCNEQSREIQRLKEELAASESAKEGVEEQYENLVGKISHIKSTLGERLKSDAEELASYRATVEKLEQANKNLEETIDTLQREVIGATRDSDKLSRELSALRSEYQDNILKWEKEQNTLVDSQRRTEEELTRARSAVRDLEVALSDGKSMSEGVHSKLIELEEQVASQTNYAERFRTERDELEKSLHEMQETLQTKQMEFSEKLGMLYTETQQCQEKLDSKEKQLQACQSKLDQLELASEKMPLLEKEIKDKNWQIGKLRHEAVILNEHLTKALRLIKKDSEGETVDKQLITNLIVSFVTIPRGDTKKFEVLQLIANCLSWDEDMRVQVGLARGTNGARTPAIGSPKRRFSSNSLAEEGASGGGLMSLFAEFLEKESTKTR